MMNTLKLKVIKDEPGEVRDDLTGKVMAEALGKVKRYGEYVLFSLCLLLWFLTPLMAGEDRALVTDGLWQLVLMSAICFMGIVGLCWWLLKRFWMIMGLPDLGSMVVRFKQMKSCYQIGFYLASFALLLLVALGCLMAVL